MIRQPAGQVNRDDMDHYQLQPAALPAWGQRSALRLLQLFGWRVRCKPLPGPHGVAVVYPHTSNWDFVGGLLARWAVGTGSADRAGAAARGRREART